MAIATKPTTKLEFKRRSKDDAKKIMIYGNDGSGKSVFAEKYCKDNGLKPVCIDIDDTNYTDVPIVNIDISSDLKTYNGLIEIIDAITESEEFDTIILDGLTSLLELLVSTAKGLAKYSDRATRFQKILRKLQMSGKHLIFIGQADMEVIYNDDHQSSKAVIKINSIVNEKYHCYITDKGEYKVDTVKYRTVKDNKGIKGGN